MEQMRATHAYIGIRPSDGSVRAICCDDPGYEKETARAVAEWIREGRIVERLPIEEARMRMRAQSLEPNPTPTTPARQA